MPGAAKVVYISPDKTVSFELPYVHASVMGKPGSGKSKLGASFPKKILVLATDPMTKMQPYFDEGMLDPEEHVGPLGQEIRLVRDRAANEVIIQIEGFYDKDPSMVTSAMTSLLNRMSTVVQEVNSGIWRTVIVDSWSGVEDCARHRRLAGPMMCHNPDGRAHHNIAKEDCKQMFVMQLIHLKCNLLVTFHITEKMQEGGGSMLYTMKTIGDFHTTVGQNMAERWLAEAMPDGTTRQLKTRPDGRFELATLIDAPSPCANTYQALWGNFVMKRAAEAKPAADKSDTVTAASTPPAATTGA